jgi:hypothetical protein
MGKRMNRVRKKEIKKGNEYHPPFRFSVCVLFTEVFTGDYRLEK